MVARYSKMRSYEVLQNISKRLNFVEWRYRKDIRGESKLTAGKGTSRSMVLDREVSLIESTTKGILTKIGEFVYQNMSNLSLFRWPSFQWYLGVVGEVRWKRKKSEWAPSHPNCLEVARNPQIQQARKVPKLWKLCQPEDNVTFQDAGWQGHLKFTSWNGWSW